MNQCQTFATRVPKGFLSLHAYLTMLIAFGLTGRIGLAGETVPIGKAARSNVDFAREVRPILSQYCFKCHGPDEKTRHGGLRLDVRENAIHQAESGEVAIRPFDAAGSELLRRVGSQDADTLMPPPHTKQTLGQSEIALLKRWIEEGAEYAEHWAFQPLGSVVADVPTGKVVMNGPIDALIQAQADRAGLPVAGQADRKTWIRRASLDLTGLPPTYEETQAFESDPNPDARERVVDRLLSSPAFGERWARRWLDLARYADTNGYEKDRPRSIWPYRDWVIRAFNDDMPLDAFTKKQLAGDLLSNPSQEDLVATGFHRNTMLNEEGGIDPLEYRFYAMVDRVNTTGTIWLGMTLGCTQCHDHKYDPLTQQDYYSFMAILNDTEEPEIAIEDAAIRQELENREREINDLRDRRRFAFPMDTELAHWQPATLTNVRSQAGVEWKIDAGRAASDMPAAGAPGGASGGAPNAQPPKRPPAKKTAKNKKGESQPNAPSTDVFDKDTTRVSFKLGADPSDSNQNARRSLVAVRLRALPIQGKAVSDSNKTGGDSVERLGWSQSGNFVLSRVQLERLSVDENSLERQVPLVGTRATYRQPGFAEEATLDDSDRSGWGIAGHGQQECTIVWFLEEPVALDSNSDTNLQLVLEQNFGERHLIGAFELEACVVAEPASRIATLREESFERSLRSWISATSKSVARWNHARIQAAEANEAKLIEQPDRSFLAIGDITKRDYYDLTLANVEQGTTAIMLEVLPDPSQPRQGPGRTYYEGPIGDFFLSEVKLWDGREQAIVIADATSDYAAAGREPKLALDLDPATGWAIDGGQGKAHQIVFHLAQPLKQSETMRLHLLFERYYASPIGRFRVLTTTDPITKDVAQWDAANQNALLSAVGRLQGLDLDGEHKLLVNLFLNQASEIAKFNLEIAKKESSKPKLPTTLVLSSRPEGFVRKTFRYHRGEFLNPRELVSPRGPAFLQGTVPIQPVTRLELAQWLMHPKNPLVARVLANRFWANMFGRGIVSTEEDFGFQGAWPSNQALLDWLSKELAGGNWENESSTSSQSLAWSLKRWLRQIVLSETYGRDSAVKTQALEMDAANTLLTRGSRKRLEAEQLRDAALQSAGLLTRRIGGPSVFPPQPATVTTEGTYGKMQWQVSTGADRYRRGLYTYSKRTAPFAMLQTFDAPSGEACIARRESTDTPLQALTTLNDEAFMEVAVELGRLSVESLAESQLTSQTTNSEVVRFLFRRILLREPTSGESSTMTDFLHAQRTELSQASGARGIQSSQSLLSPMLANANDQRKELAIAGALVARVLLNTDEFIMRN